MLLTWEIVGQHCHSSSSAATCAQKVEESQRMGGLTIEETSDRQDSARKASDKRRKETRDGRKDDGA